MKTLKFKWQYSLEFANNHKKNQGFTFIEMLVSLLILGLVSGLLLINLVPNTQTKLRDEVRRLEDVLTLASDFSRLSGRRLLWHWQEESGNKRYVFQVQERDRSWLPFTSSNSLADSLNSHQVPNFIEIREITLDGQELAIDNAKIYFNPSGINPLFSLTIAVIDKPNQVKEIQSDPLGRVFETKTLIPINN